VSYAQGVSLHHWAGRRYTLSTCRCWRKPQQGELGAHIPPKTAIQLLAASRPTLSSDRAAGVKRFGMPIMAVRGCEIFVACLVLAVVVNVQNFNAAITRGEA